MKGAKVINFFVCAVLCFLGIDVLAQIENPIKLTDVRAFEVSACKPSRNSIVCAWMEKRSFRIDNRDDAENMLVAYRGSKDNGISWSEKRIIDLPKTFATGNPFVGNNDKGETFLACMHIGEDFYSGNISFYKYDSNKNAFNLKSVPIKSSDNLLDKPSFVCNGKDIHLVYVAYTKNFKNSVKYQMSRDNGESWSDPVNVFQDHSITYLGPAITLTGEKKILVSAGSYGQKDIYSTLKEDGNDKHIFQTQKIVGGISPQLGAAMTELSKSGNKLIMSWQNPHQRNEAWLTLSSDNGVLWEKPYLVTDKGNLLSASLDSKGRVHSIYSDFSNEKFAVGYKVFDNKFRILKQRYLLAPKPLDNFNEYLGAYQKLIVQKDEIFAFWIDYVNNSTLNFSHWKI